MENNSKIYLYATTHSLDKCIYNIRPASVNLTSVRNYWLHMKCEKQLYEKSKMKKTSSGE